MGLLILKGWICYLFGAVVGDGLEEAFKGEFRLKAFSLFK